MTSLATATDDMMRSIDAGIKSIDAQLDLLFAAEHPDEATVKALHDLRDRYVFDRMILVHAKIKADDDSADLAAAVRALSSAIEEMKKIQERSTTTKDWIDRASSALDEALSLYKKISKA